MNHNKQAQYGMAVAAVLISAALVAPAHAAGGHHAVDDAAMLDPGQCQFESWTDRERGGARTVWHAGPACRVGLVELGLNIDRQGGRSEPTTSLVGVQLKWAREWRPGLDVGVLVTATAQDRGPRYAGSSAVGITSVTLTETLKLHAVAGRDFRREASDIGRAGAALEWSPNDRWSMVGERFRENETNHWRSGVRWAVSPSFSVDVSRAHHQAGHWWTVGLSRVWDR